LLEVDFPDIGQAAGGGTTTGVGLGVAGFEEKKSKNPMMLLYTGVSLSCDAYDRKDSLYL